MIGNLKLKQSILLGYAIPLVLIIAVAVFVLASIRKTQEISQRVESTHEIMHQLDQFQQAMSKTQKSVRGYMLLRNETSLKHAEEGMKEFQQSAATLKQLVKDPVLAAQIEKATQLVNLITVVARDALAAAQRGEADKALMLFRTGNSIHNGMEADAIMDDLGKQLSDTMDKLQKKESDSLSALVNAQGYGVLLAIILAVILGVWNASRISRTIAEAVNAASSTSTEIAATVSQHERNANQQVAMVNETTTTLEELSVSSRQSAEQAARAADLARTASTMTDDGNEAVRQAVEAMDSLRIRMSAIADHILSLSDQTGQIGSIAELVKDLSTQINMLALNAAVEAARAGEHGKGFAVVAAEVRKLSVESKKSAEQTRSIVSGIQKATDTTIMKAEEGARDVESVTAITQKMSRLFESISEVAAQVYQNTQQVVLNTRQQSSAIGQVVEAANSINAGARETAAGLEQTKIAILNLNESTEKLKSTV